MWLLLIQGLVQRWKKQWLVGGTPGGQDFVGELLCWLYRGPCSSMRSVSILGGWHQGNAPCQALQTHVSRSRSMPPDGFSPTKDTAAGRGNSLGCPHHVAGTAPGSRCPSPAQSF